jgi:hypothetical protein
VLLLPLLSKLRLTLRVELDFDKLAGLSGRGYPLPFLNGIMSRRSLKLHTTGKAGILGSDAGYNLAIAF